MSTEPLSEREQQCLEHLRRAQELDVSLSEYARSFEVDVKELYSTKRTLVQRGLLAGGTSRKDAAAKSVQASDFVPVQVSPRRPPTPSGALCRIQHPSGLVIECMTFPPASWLAVLLPGGRDVPA
jgi:hypothetical protein